MRVGMVGVGAMGLAMAGHIAKSGHQIVACDTNPEALKNATSVGVTPVKDLNVLANRADIFIVMVATDDQSRSVVNTLVDCGLPTGAVIVVTATNHPRTMIELAAVCEDRGVGFVDAPVCYGLQGAEAGNLVSLCGGKAESIERVRPILMAYSRSVEHIGGYGAGQLAKTCNNMMHWAACVANYETLALAKTYGINAQSMRETLLKCPARNTTLERWDTTRFTWHEKDMEVALNLAQDAQLSLPLFALVDRLVKKIGPDQVRALLYEDSADYLGQKVAPRENGEAF